MEDIVKKIIKNFSCEHIFFSKNNEEKHKSEANIKICYDNGNVLSMMFRKRFNKFPRTIICIKDDIYLHVDIILVYDPNGILEVDISLITMYGEHIDKNIVECFPVIDLQRLSFCLRLTILSFLSSVIEFASKLAHEQAKACEQMHKIDKNKIFNVIKQVNSNEIKVKSQNNVIATLTKIELARVKNILQGKGEQKILEKYTTHPFSLDKLFDISDKTIIHPISSSNVS